MKSIKFGALVFFLTSISSHAMAQELPSDLSSYAIAKVFLFLLLIIAMILGLAWIAKRLNFTAVMQQKHIQIISSIPLSNREKAVLIEIDKTRMLIGVAPGNVNLLHVLPQIDTDPTHVDSKISNQTNVFQQDIVIDNASSKSFAQFLKKMLVTGSLNETK